MTARHFGFSPDSISRWARAYDAFGLAGLEPGSRPPKRMRQPRIPSRLNSKNPGGVILSATEWSEESPPFLQIILKAGEMTTAGSWDSSLRSE